MATVEPFAAPPKSATHPVPALLGHALIVGFILIGTNLAALHSFQEANILQRWLANHTPNTSKIIVLGNSLSYRNVHPATLEKELHKDVLRISKTRIGSAWWYLTIKNQIVKMNPKPELVILISTIPKHLMDPAFRTTGRSGEELYEISNLHEPALDAKIHSNMELGILRRLPLFKMRYKIRDFIYESTRDSISAILGLTARQTEVLLGKVLVIKEEDDSSNPKETPIEESLIPDMVDEMRNADIPFIIVRSKTKTHVLEEDTPQDAEYVHKLSLFLQERGVEFWDYSKRLSLSESEFADEIHFTLEGREKFTKLIIEDLEQYFQK